MDIISMLTVCWLYSIKGLYICIYITAHLLDSRSKFKMRGPSHLIGQLCTRGLCSDQISAKRGLCRTDVLLTLSTIKVITFRHK